MSVYIEFVGGPLDGAVQKWPESRPPGREISPVSRPSHELAGDPLSVPRRATYRRGREQPYGVTPAVKVLYEFEELVPGNRRP